MAEEFKYYAFISYKREDEKWARWLQHKLEYYRIPTTVRKHNPTLPERVRPIFKDTTDLSGGVLEKEINQALEQSKYLIVICSPRAAKSPWVCKEVQRFIDLGKEESIIPFIIDGTPFSDEATECFPAALKTLSGEKELLGINIAENGQEAAAVKVVARMFNTSFDVLWQRFRRNEKRRRRIIATIAALFILSLLCVTGFIWEKNIQLEDRNRTIAQQNDSILKERDRANRERDRANLERDRANTAYDSIFKQQLTIEEQNKNLILANYTIANERDRVKTKHQAMLEQYARVMCFQAIQEINNNQIIKGVRILNEIVPESMNDPDKPFVGEMETALRLLHKTIEEPNYKVLGSYSLPDDMGTMKFDSDPRYILTMDYGGVYRYDLLNSCFTDTLFFTDNSNIVLEYCDTNQGVVFCEREDEEGTDKHYIHNYKNGITREVSEDDYYKALDQLPANVLENAYLGSLESSSFPKTLFHRDSNLSVEVKRCYEKQTDSIRVYRGKEKVKLLKEFETDLTFRCDPLALNGRVLLVNDWNRLKALDLEYENIFWDIDFKNALEPRLAFTPDNSLALVQTTGGQLYLVSLSEGQRNSILNYDMLHRELPIFMYHPRGQEKVYYDDLANTRISTFYSTKNKGFYSNSATISDLKNEVESSLLQQKDLYGKYYIEILNKDKDTGAPVRVRIHSFQSPFELTLDMPSLPDMYRCHICFDIDQDKLIYNGYSDDFSVDTIYVYDLSTQKVEHRRAFNKSISEIAKGSEPGVVWIGCDYDEDLNYVIKYDYVKGSKLAEININQTFPSSIIEKNGILAIKGLREVEVYDTHSGQRIFSKTFLGSGNMDLSTDGKYLLFASEEDDVNIYNIMTGLLVDKYTKADLPPWELGNLDIFRRHDAYFCSYRPSVIVPYSEYIFRDFPSVDNLIHNLKSKLGSSPSKQD